MTFQHGALVRATNRPITRRQAFGIAAAAATAAVLRRLRTSDVPAEETAAWQPPPAYDGIVGIL